MNSDIFPLIQKIEEEQAEVKRLKGLSQGHASLREPGYNWHVGLLTTKQHSLFWKMILIYVRGK